MNKVSLFLFFIIAAYLSAPNLANSSEQSFEFKGQREEVLSLESILHGTEYREETIQTTCTREIPYQETVCGMETRYEEICNQGPARRECRTIIENVCRNERRHREECSEQGGGRQCRTIPGDIVCHRAPNGENRCQKIPPREVCEDRPRRRECRSVPHDEHVCEKRPRESCEWLPPQIECRQFPRTERVCRLETRYRTEEYACMKTVQVPYPTILKKNFAVAHITFDEQQKAEQPLYFQLRLSDQGELSLSGKSLDGNVGVFTKKSMDIHNTGIDNHISAKYPITIVNLKDLFQVTKSPILESKIHKREVKFKIRGHFNKANTKLYVKITKKGDLKFEKTLLPHEFENIVDGEFTYVVVRLDKVGGPKLSGVFQLRHKVEFALSFDLSHLGEMVMPDANSLILRGEFEKDIE